MFKVYMAVNQSGQYGLVFKINHFISGRRFCITSEYIRDRITFYYNGIFGQYLSFSNIYQFTTVQNSTL
jgi:hypothetical protein